jgi:hypothetical protein
MLGFKCEQAYLLSILSAPRPAYRPGRRHAFAPLFSPVRQRADTMSTFRLPGFAALPRRPAHICVTKDGTEVDSVPISDKALLFGRKVHAHHPSPSRPPPLPSPIPSSAVTDMWLHTYGYR